MEPGAAVTQWNETFTGLKVSWALALLGGAKGPVA